MTHTYTLAKLALSQSAYDEIKLKLVEAGYEHTFMPDGEGIDMTHIAVVLEEDTRPRKRMDLPSGRGYVFPSKDAQESCKGNWCKYCCGDNPELPHLVNNECELYWEHRQGSSGSRHVCTRYGNANHTVHAKSLPKEENID